MFCSKWRGSVSACLQCAGTEQLTKAEIAKEIKHSEFVRKKFESALEKAAANKEVGFLELYDIASDPESTVEYQEVANDALTELLYTNTELWIKVFSKTKNFKFYFGVLPQAIPEEKYNEIVLLKLNKIIEDPEEKRLAIYMTKRINGEVK